VSKRHQSSRRKTYGRRQHELTERRGRELSSEPLENDLDELGTTALSDRFAFFDARTPPLYFSLGD
jgi:ribosomal protein S8E